MIPLLKAGNPVSCAEQKLENIADSIEKLELFLSAMSRIHYDDHLPSDEFNAIMCSLHLQVYEIRQQLAIKP